MLGKSMCDSEGYAGWQSLCVIVRAMQVRKVYV